MTGKDMAKDPMVEALRLPPQVSADGSELWEWAGRFSQAVHRQARIAELGAQIRKVTCGDCSRWMKSRECPRERNVNGWNRGPSCEDLPCGIFSESASSTKLRDERRSELTALRAVAVESRA
jgi:hypothetical protein